MILSNVEIHNALDDGLISITPEPKPRFASVDEPNCPYDSTAVDLTLSEKISVPKEGLAVSLDLRSKSVVSTLATLYEDETINRVNGFLLEPHRFILGNTIETVSLSAEIAARVEGKSSRSRMGLLVHFTAPTIHAGFEGTITLEMINLGAIPLQIFPGIPICQLIFERVDGTPVKFTRSQFQCQQKPVGPTT